MVRMLKTIGVLAALAAAPALAHEHGGRAMGTVERIGPERIAIKTSDGHVVDFAVTSDTRFTQGDAAVRATDVRVGEPAVVHGVRRGDALTAVEVKLPPATK